MRKIKKITLMILSMILPLLLVVCFTLASTSYFNKSASTSAVVDPKDVTIWHIGSSNVILDTILVKMQQLGAEVKRPNNTSISASLNEMSLVVFDGDWISERINDYDIHRFLGDACRGKAKLIAAGGSTSRFFEALDKAGINELGRDDTGNMRNPAYFNPPIVGFKLKQAITPNGQQYSYPSIFTSNTLDIDVMVQALTNWLGE